MMWEHRGTSGVHMTYRTSPAGSIPARRLRRRLWLGSAPNHSWKRFTAYPASPENEGRPSLGHVLPIGISKHPWARILLRDEIRRRLETPTFVHQ